MSSSQPQHSPPGFFADDLIPALAKFSKFLDTLAQPAIIILLALFPFPILGYDWRSNNIPVHAQPSVILLLVAGLAYFGAFHREPSDEGNRVLLAWLAEPWAALQTVYNRVGAYFRLGLFVALTFYLAIYYDLPTPFQPWLQGVSVSAIAILGFFSPVQKFHGPIRFGYIEYSAQFTKIYESLPTCWTYTALLLILPHLILPWLGLGIILLLAVIFVYTSHQYRRQLDTIRVGVATEVSRAAIAAGFARDYVAETKDCEAKLLKIVAITRKDVLQAESIKFVDFFDCAIDGWAALGMLTEPVKDVAAKARAVIKSAMDANQADMLRQLERGRGGGDTGDDDENEESEDEDDKDDGGIADELLDSAKLAVEKAEGAERHLKDAQEVMLKSQQAARQHDIAREKAVSIASEAIAASKDLASQIKDVGITLCETVEAAERARRLGEEATAIAIDGEMQAARSLVITLKSTAKEVEDLKKMLATKAGACHSIVHNLLEKL